MRYTKVCQILTCLRQSQLITNVLWYGIILIVNYRFGILFLILKIQVKLILKHNFLVLLMASVLMHRLHSMFLTIVNQLELATTSFISIVPIMWGILFQTLWALWPILFSVLSSICWFPAQIFIYTMPDLVVVLIPKYHQHHLRLVHMQTRDLLEIKEINSSFTLKN